MASAVLKPVAEKLITEGLKAELVGTTALSEADSGHGSLSSRRAEAVKDVLVGLGVAETALTTKGVGTNFAAYPKPPAPPPAPAELAQYRLVYVQIAGSRC